MLQAGTANLGSINLRSQFATLDVGKPPTGRARLRSQFGTSDGKPPVFAAMTENAIVPVERIERVILVVRGHRVILDKHLAALYEVTTGNLNKAVARNLERFPDDFMFQLSADEMKNLIFHFGTSSWGGTRKTPRAFTEQGVAMLSSVLRSPRAVQVNIEIMRTFVRLRQMLQQNADLARKLAALERSTTPSSRSCSTPSAS